MDKDTFSSSFYFQTVVVQQQPCFDPLGASYRNALWDVNVLDLPPNLFSEICDDLNDSKDWSLVAGMYIGITDILRKYFDYNKQF